MTIWVYSAKLNDDERRHLSWGASYRNHLNYESAYDILAHIDGISVCGSCSSFMLWCSSCRARPSGHVLICLGLVHIVALQGGALAIFFAWTWFI